MQTSFPQPSYLTAKQFQDNEKTLTYKGWEKVSNEDDPSNKQNPRTWKQKLKYMLPYSYPEWAVDEAGDKKVGRDGEPFRNKYWDDAYPRGYAIKYIFDEGELEAGSKPLFEAFCQIQPKPGEQVKIMRTGEDKETKWSVRRANQSTQDQVIDMDSDLEPDEEIPF